MGWAILGVTLTFVYFFTWCLLFVSSHADDQAIREWERRRDDLRGDSR